MLESLFSYISTQGAAGIERALAGTLSLLVTAGASLSGYMGDTQKMLASSLNNDNVEINVEFELYVNADELTKQLDELNAALETEVEYSNNPETVPKGYPTGFFGGYTSHFLFNDKLEFTPTKLVFPENDIPGIYENGELSLEGNLTFSYSKEEKCGSVVIDIDGAEGDNAVFFNSDKITFSPDLTQVVLEFLDSDVRTVYAEHFKSLAYSCDTKTFLSMLLDENNKLSKILDGFSFYSHSLPEALTSLTPDEALTLLEDSEFISLFMSFFKEYSKPVAKHFVKRTVDGCDARIFELTGKEYLDYKTDHYDYLKDNDKVLDAYKALTDYVHKTEKLSFLAESELFELTDKKEIKSAISSYAHRRKNIAMAMNTSPISRPVPNVNLLRFYYANSKLKHTVFKSDTDTHSRLEFTVAKSESNALATLKINSVISNAKKEIATPDSAFDDELRINDELFDSKLSQREAQRKGVELLEITWSSQMTSGAASPTVSDTEFYVNYKDGEVRGKSSLAHLVDGSVYLPLRQLMENAGYEVSWDAENYKAYVTVDGQKIEMTGKLIDSKTYVKVRDFEKLGATVDYSEKIHYANAYDNFSKQCNAKISFK